MEKKIYLRGTTIIPKGLVCNNCFHLLTGLVAEQKENTIVSYYQPNDYIYLTELFTTTTATSSYIALQNSSGYWLTKTEILNQSNQYLTLLSMQIQKEKALNELLQINDPITKVSRYLFYEFESKKLYTIYITMTIELLCQWLAISHQNLLSALRFLENKQIISKKNKLINLINLSKLKFYAFNN